MAPSPQANVALSPTTVVPRWNTRDLLNPRRAGGPSSSLPPTRPLSPNDPAVTVAPVQLDFQFSSANDDSHLAPPPSIAADTGHSAGMNGDSTAGMANGVGSMIERNFGVQDRSSVPVPKRRKIEDPESDSEAKRRFAGGSSGMLGAHVKDQQAELKDKRSQNKVVTVDLTGSVDDDVVILERPKDEDVCYGQVEDAAVNCHRVPSPKPNAVALGGPGFWPQVKIVLRRKLGDQSIAIPVIDHTRQVCGHLDPRVSKALVPLLDAPNVRLRTDARIPSRRKAENEVVGQPASHKYKIQLTLYGPLKYARSIGRNLAERGIHLANPLRIEPGYRWVNAQAPRSALVAPPSGLTRSGQYGSAISSSVTAVSRTVEEVRSEIMGVFDSMTKHEDLPQMEPDERITTKLLKHQKQALYFMTNREKPREESQLTASIWQKKTGKARETIWLNVITGESQRHVPDETYGGILADMMGLGKTLSVLCLVSSTLEDAEMWRRTLPVQPRMVSEPRKSNSFQVPRPEPLPLTQVARNGRATLLICPLTVISNWEEQIKQHVKAKALTYHIYHGNNRIKDVKTLASCDLVITTYNCISTELRLKHTGKFGVYPLEQIAWFRIVLDEGHVVRTATTRLFKAICRLQAHRRWAVTGTPVQNRLEDLGSLLAFLRLQPFDQIAKFGAHIVAPFKACNPEIIPKIRILVDTITLRRHKDKIDLPPRREEIVKLEFTPAEKRLYEVYLENANERLQVLTNHHEKLPGGKTYIHVLQSILRLRKVCAHGRELLNEDDLAVLQGTQAAPINLDDDEEEDTKNILTDAKAYQMFDLMVDTGNDECAHCHRKLSTIDDDAEELSDNNQEDLMGYMTPCYHLYCPSHIRHFKDMRLGLSHDSGAFGTCPECEQQIQFHCVGLRRTRADAEQEAHEETSGGIKDSRGGIRLESYGGPHTKVRALVGDLMNYRAESEKQPDEAPIKSVVFSQWTTNLDLIQIALDDAGIIYCRLDGKMSRNARNLALDAFRENPAVHVILVSISAGGVGLNLTAGSNVFVMEPHYNPAAEAQAIERVHRLGQKRPVRIVRYIMKDSTEERMLELQARKTQLANLSMNRGKMDRGEAALQRLHELKSLFK